MKAIFAVMLMILSVTASAAYNPTSVVPTPAFEQSFNRFAGGLGYKYSLGTVLKQAHHTAVGVYDVSKHGGGVAASSTLYPVGIYLPTKAIITRVLFDVVTAPVLTAGSVQLGFQAESSLDIKALTALGTWTGRLDGIQQGTTSNDVKLTANRSVYVVVSSSSVGTLTAGKIKVFVDYVVSE